MYLNTAASQFHGTCAPFHGKAPHFYAEARFLGRTCAFLRRSGGPYGPPEFTVDYCKVLYCTEMGSLFWGYISKCVIELPRRNDTISVPKQHFLVAGIKRA